MERGRIFSNGAADSPAAAAVAANFVSEQRTTLDLVQQRFKADETVHLVSCKQHDSSRYCLYTYAVINKLISLACFEFLRVSDVPMCTYI